MMIQDNFGKGHELKNKPQALNFEDRVQRGLKFFGIYFLIALGSVAVPVLHFFLVPLFLILSLYQGVTKYHQMRCLNLEDEICPVCNKTLKNGIGYFEEDTLRTNCRSCRTQLIIKDENEKGSQNG